MVIYIILVLALLVGIGYLAYSSYIENLEQEEHVRQAAAQETEYESEIRKKVEAQSETSTTTTTEGGTTAATTTTAEGGTTAARTTTAEDGTTAATTTTTEDSVTATSESEFEREKSIAVLNATGAEGIAAKWQEALTAQGYKNLAIGSYNQQKTTTIICTADEKLAQTLKSIFTDATIQDALPTEGSDISLDNADACVIVGTDNKDIQ